jgi:predicted O-methyltransferase YrrM
MTRDWVQSIFDHDVLSAMGHGQRVEDHNLGLGWLYYALGRMVRPKHAVCIGSWRGFVPIVLGTALQDNGEGGRITFIDPSLVDEFWMDHQRTSEWFASFGLDNVDHHCVTTEAFMATEAYRILGQVGLLFIDGYHTAEQARFDHEAFADRLTDDAVVAFHDSIRAHSSGIYGEDKRYVHSVHQYMDELKRRPHVQVMDFPLGSGVTLVRRAAGDAVAVSEASPYAATTSTPSS